MSGLPIRFVTRHYDIVVPLQTGEITPEGIDLQLDCDTPMAAFLAGDGFDAGELSISQYVRRISAGQRDIVGLPIMLCRGFRQRSFFVRQGSKIRDFSAFPGKRVGTNGWPDSGNTWGRSLIREAGVELSTIDWTVGPIDDWNHPMYGPPQVNVAGVPDHVRKLSDGETLVDLLLDGQLDVLMVNRPPKAFHEPDELVVRLFPNYRDVEADYAERVGFYPCSHIVGIRPEIVEQHPWVVTSLFDAFEASRTLVESRRAMLADTTPWTLDDYELIERKVGPDWQAHGVEPNRKAVETICNEFLEQGIIQNPVGPDQLFETFLKVYSSRG